jgi:DNA-binding CsgD family transcriptional regulator
MALQPADGHTRVWSGPAPALTRREVRILELIAAGWSTRRIAEILSVSEQAVTYHVGNLLAKFATENRAGLVGRAFVFGYLLADGWPPRVDPAADPS